MQRPYFSTPPEVIALNGESGALTLTSLGGSVTITQPSANTINLEASGTGTGVSGANSYIQYNHSGVFGSDSGFTRDPVTFETIATATLEPNIVGKFHIGTEAFTPGSIPGSLNVINNTSTGTHIAAGAADASALGGSTEAALLLAEDSLAGISYIYADSFGGSPRVVSEAYLAALPNSGMQFSMNQDQFQVLSTGASGLYLSLNHTSRQYGMGDLDSTGNGTAISISDISRLMLLTANRNLIAQDSSGNRYLELSPQFATYTIGADAFGNGTNLQLNDGAGTATLSANSNQWMLVDGSAHSLQLGDYTGTFNGSRLIIDDAAQLISSTTPIDLGGNFIHNVKDPVSLQDAVTLNYANGIATGIKWKQLVRLATAAALPTNVYLAGVITMAATGVLTVDGVAVALNDRILVKDEATQANNGIYTCTTAGAVGAAAVLTRSTDANTGPQLVGAAASASAGSTNIGKAYVQTTPATITVGTTAIVFVQFLNSVYTAGTGLTLTGQTFSLTAPVTAALGGTGQTSYTNGQLLIGNTGTGGLTKSTLTAGANITITNSAGGITIASTGGGGSGTVTNVATDGFITGGPITTTGTVSAGNELLMAMVGGMRFLSGN